MSCVAQFSQDYGPFITAGAIFISGAIAAIAIVHNLRIARKRATIDLVMHERLNKTNLDARGIVLGLHEAEAEFVGYALRDKASTEEAKAILVVLNFYEFAAAGIRDGAFDEAMFRRMQYSMVLRDWGALEGFVRELRKARGSDTLFCEFQRLAESWRRKPLKV
ncbi:MAG: DUF4760 domain-containing protein [Burkholderiales bacterium]